MRKALAQNPNLLRTLMGLGLTLIILLGYAVYGATVSPDYYLYHTESTETVVEIDEPTRFYNADKDETTWMWDATLNGFNLTWVNLSVTQISDEGLVSISNAAGLYSHESLGDPDAEEFSCAVSCRNLTAHSTNASDGEAEIFSLTDPNPELRGTSALYAESLEEATEQAKEKIATNLTPVNVKITIIESGNRSTHPNVELTQVNEEFMEIEQFEVDAATEFMWALAAVIGCFSMVLVPSFTIYLAAQAKQKRVEIRLEKAAAELEVE